MATESSQTLALRPREAAKALSISPRHLWQLTHDGVIPCVRIGAGKRKSVLYPIAELQAWLSRQAEAAVAAEHPNPPDAIPSDSDQDAVQQQMSKERRNLPLKIASEIEQQSGSPRSGRRSLRSEDSNSEKQGG